VQLHAKSDDGLHRFDDWLTHANAEYSPSLPLVQQEAAYDCGWSVTHDVMFRVCHALMVISGNPATVHGPVLIFIVCSLVDRKQTKVFF
jgi:hypothetical protein